MKCQSLFSGKNKKIISECHLLKFLPSMLSGKSYLMFSLAIVLLKEAQSPLKYLHLHLLVALAVSWIFNSTLGIV